MDFQRAANFDGLDALPPEILRLIADNCQRNDISSLGMTCKSFFDSLMPVVWEVLDGPEKILSLIPGAKVNRVKLEAIGSYDIRTEIIIYPDTLSKDWTRYWFYAQFVKHLVAARYANFGCLRTTCSIQGWNTVFQILKDGALLPNLRTLEFPFVDGINIGALHLLSWFALFLSPSLHKITIIHCQLHRTQFPTSPAVLLITSLATTLRTAKKIDLPSGYSFPTESTLKLLCPSGYRERHYWFTHLPNLKGLRNLSIQDFGFSDRPIEGLFVLGHLPYLESLSIRCHSSLIEMKTPTFSPELFPHLHYLTIEADTDGFRYIWSLGTMVSKLSVVALRLMSNTITHHEVQTDLIPVLAKHSPDVKHLGIFWPRCVRIMHRLENEPLEVELVLELVSLLPLQSLGLHLAKKGAVEESHFAHPERRFPAFRHLILTNAHSWPCTATTSAMFPNLSILEELHEDDDLELLEERAEVKPSGIGTSCGFRKIIGARNGPMDMSYLLSP
ncbi:unnamed protein product [Rhizoctonia solani]|uniref:F-box domain-containing protein n=1 Tax=Rhizoctonia solani TaxID=456999 RepID=A0A8H3BXB2_9AGAM|nr:unnamed protein product [Rhizoctonia solani]